MVRDADEAPHSPYYINLLHSPMNIVLIMIRTVIVDDQHQLLDIQSSRRDASSDQKLHLPRLEVHNGGVPVELINPCNRPPLIYSSLDKMDLCRNYKRTACCYKVTFWSYIHLWIPHLYFEPDFKFEKQMFENINKLLILIVNSVSSRVIREMTKLIMTFKFR